MTPQRWRNTCAYLREVFGGTDDQLEELKGRAAAAGLPDIAISSDVGRLLMLLTMLAGNNRGATLAVELGTLGGYSGVWIARGLGEGGRLITVEIDPGHAEFAEREFRRAGLAGRVQVRRGAALDVLPALGAELGPASVGLAFLDAEKTEYGDYLRLLRPMLRPGAVLVADNALGSSFWIDDPPGSSAARDAIDAFNRRVAADDQFDAAAVPIRQGLLIARKRS